MRCVCCHHEEFSYQYTLRDLSFGEDGEWDFVCCNKCGHGFLSPIPTEEEKMGQSKAHIGQSHGVLFDDCPYFGNRGRILL